LRGQNRVTDLARGSEGRWHGSPRTAASANHAGPRAMCWTQNGAEDYTAGDEDKSSRPASRAGSVFSCSTKGSKRLRRYRHAGEIAENRHQAAQQPSIEPNTTALIRRP